MKLHLHFTKSPQRDNIYKGCLWMPEKPICLILTSKLIPKPRYIAYAKKCKPFPHCTKSIKRNDMEIYCLWIEDEHNY